MEVLKTLLVLRTEASWGTGVRLMTQTVAGHLFRVMSPIVSIVSFGGFFGFRREHPWRPGKPLKQRQF